jgi:alcohol dehydrogenase class IV
MFRYDQPRQVFACGAGAIDQLPSELTALGVSRLGLVGTRRSLSSVAGEQARKRLSGFAVTHTFDVVRAHAPISDTEAMARVMIADPPDALVAIGGGSVSDTAKALSIVLAEGFPLAARCSTFTPPGTLRHVDLPNPKIPVIAIPTTLSGAEVTPGGGATDESGTKRVFWDPKVASRVVVYDPELLADAPASILAATGMNGLAHCIEAMYSRTASPISTGLALEGARLFARSLPHLDESGLDRIAVLDQALTAACIGGLVISNGRVGLHHAACHVLGAAFGVPHGVANSVMLPYVLAFNEAETGESQRRFSHAVAPELGADPNTSAAELVALIQQRAGVPATLAEVDGLRLADLPRVAEGVMQDRGLFFNPTPVASADVVLAILHNAWNGKLRAAT